MSNPRNEIDAWLDRDVEPLVPPPGTFERISKRARQRKRKQVAMSAAAAVAVIVAVTVAPQVASRLLQHKSGLSTPPAAAGQSPAARPSTGPAKSAASPTPSPTAPAPPATSSPPWATPTGVPAPSRFRPSSITLIGPDVGAVIGQASCAAGQGGLCTSLAATVSDGSTWYGGLSAPAGPPPGASGGASQLRFLDARYGWAYGPWLYATSDSGASWVRLQTPGGLRVTDLETAGDHAFALLASCGGTGSSYAADCASFSLYSSLAGTTGWQPVRVPNGDAAMTGSPSGHAAAASLVLASGTRANPDAGAGYLLTPAGALLAGPLTGAAWTAAGQIPGPCQVGAAQPGGQPAGAQLAAGSMASGPQLLLSCNVAAGTGGGTQIEIYSSLTNGRTWKAAGTVPGAATATSLATTGGAAVLATSAGIDYSAGGGTWQPSSFTTASAAVIAAPAHGFSYVGMTTALQGVAVPADTGLGEVFITVNGGQTWAASGISGS